MSTALLLYCLVLGGVYLAIVTAILEWLGKKLAVDRDMPTGLLETTGPSWYALNYMMDFLFFVVAPTFAHALFYVVLPLSGARTGAAAALFAFTLGMAPAIIGLAVRVKMPMPYLLYFLVGMLMKLAGALAIIGYLYSL